MPQFAHLDPSPFELSGNEVGVLLLHGFTGAPTEMRPMAEYLAAQGLTVRVPLLPGHGTSEQDLNTKTWTEIVDGARAELEALQQKCSKVFVAGLSMGGLLTLRLGETCSGIDGLIPMAAAVYLSDPMRHILPVGRFLLKTWPKSSDPANDLEDTSQFDTLWSYDRFPVPAAYQLTRLIKNVRNDLPVIRQPILIVHGKKDKMVPEKAAYTIRDRVSSTDKELVMLAGSGHCLTVDAEREMVWQRAHRFIQERSS